MKIIALVISIISVLALSACNLAEEAGDFYSNAGQIYVNTKSETELSFGITLFTSKKVNKITCIGFEGKGLDYGNYTVEIIDNNVKQLDNFFYKGLHVKILLIVVTPKAPIDNCEINRMHLNVDGTKQVIDFGTPVKHQFTGGNLFTEELLLAIIPNDFSSMFINNTEQLLIYEFNTTQAITLDQITCVDFLDLSGIAIWIDNVAAVNEFPLSIDAGKNVKIGFVYMSDQADNASYLTTNVVFSFRRSSDNMEMTNEVLITFDPVYPIIDDDLTHIKTYVDQVLVME